MVDKQTEIKMTKTPEQERAAIVSHPGKTKAQRRVLDEIGVGHYSVPMAEGTRKALLKQGLIEQCGAKVICQDRFGTVTVPEYQMPIPVHYQWCKAMSGDHHNDR